MGTIEEAIEPLAGEEAYANDVRAQIASRLRAIVDTGRGEGGEG